jgi:hypothetical protein
LEEFSKKYINTEIKEITKDIQENIESSSDGPPPPPPMDDNLGPPDLGDGPPPPPMFGTTEKIKLPKLKQYKTELNTKKVHLNIINKKNINDTIFVKKGICEDTFNIKFDENEFGLLFSNKEIVVKEKKVMEEVETLLDPKRSYNVNIGLATIRMEHECKNNYKTSIKKGIN